MDPATSYFLKKYYPHVIKWWLVVYNPDAVRIWPSQAEKEETLRLEALEEKKEKKKKIPKIEPPKPPVAPDENYNATTGSYSGLYGKQPVDAATQSALNNILGASSNQNTVDMLLANSSEPPPQNDAPDKPQPLTAEQQEVIDRANSIYNRLLREAAEDEAKKQAEIAAVRAAASEQFEQIKASQA
jgi:membrane-associated HD superfamily phosphohydrolase